MRWIVNEFYCDALKEEKIVRIVYSPHELMSSWKLRFKRIGQHGSMSYIFVFLSIHTIHAAIFHATPLNPLNRCSTTIFVCTKYARTENVHIWCVNVYVCTCIGSSYTQCACRIGAQFMKRIRRWMSERERERDTENRRKRAMYWIRTKRSHFAFSAGKISVHKRTRLWANILNTFHLLKTEKWITWLVKFQPNLKKKQYSDKRDANFGADFLIEKITY